MYYEAKYDWQLVVMAIPCVHINSFLSIAFSSLCDCVPQTHSTHQPQIIKMCGIIIFANQEGVEDGG